MTATLASALGSPSGIIETNQKNIAALKANEQYYGGCSICSALEEIITGNDQIDLLAVHSDGARDLAPTFYTKVKKILLFNTTLSTLITDIGNLSTKYNLKSWTIAEIFPATQLVQTVSLWERK